MNFGNEIRITTRFGGRSAIAALAALLCMAALLILPPAAGAATRAPLAVGSTLELPGPAGPFPDALIRNRPLLSRIDSPTLRENSYPVLGGEQVEVSSTYYTD